MSRRMLGRGGRQIGEADRCNSTSRKGSPPVIKIAIKNVGKRQVTLISGTSLSLMLLGASTDLLSVHVNSFSSSPSSRTHPLPSPLYSFFSSPLAHTQATSPGLSSPQTTSPKSSNTVPPLPRPFSLSQVAPRRVNSPRWKSCAKVSFLTMSSSRGEGNEKRQVLILFFALVGTHDALVTKLLIARGIPKQYIDVDTSKSKR